MVLTLKCYASHASNFQEEFISNEAYITYLLCHLISTKPVHAASLHPSNIQQCYTYTDDRFVALQWFRNTYN